ncbi:MAG: DUF4922 domain-containing protein [Muribaculaceae bacterium]|nr:DUF4922 domain-containing protein [Muribaculaceae bacterium]
MDYSRIVDRLITRQRRDWDEAGRNYAALDSVATRSLSLGESTVVLQFNPERRRSSAAAIDRKSLARRQCFLCAENQPVKQKAVLWGDRYKIQVNPYPIFKRHLTIADLRHVPQRLSGRVGDMLSLARSLPGFVVFYNGPCCGASAPDHAHFQAGAKGEMPLCDELAHATTHLLADGDEGFIGYVDQLGRSLFTIETSTQRAAERFALRLLDLLPVPEGGDEPMVNVLCWWDATDRLWHMVVFPRRKHRPACYGEGEGKLLLSPASVDLGGLWAVPERKDFDALTPKMVQALYDELCMSRKELSLVFSGFTHYWENLQPI